MPMYDWECSKCGAWVEDVVPWEDRDIPRIHNGCGGALERRPAASKSGKGNYQMQAVVYDGEQKVGHVAGHFGKEAKRNRK